MSGEKLALGAMGVLAIAGALRARGAQNGSDVLRRGRAKVNEGAMWKLLSEKLYGSNVDAAVVATREALQNSRDAIDRAYKQGKLGKPDGVFEVEVHTQDDGRLTLVWRDNGVGMDEDTFYHKFLSIGDSDKTGGEAAGGFGIAKAIILGVSTTFRWQMHTRDRRYVANGMDRDVEAFEAPYYQGAELRVYDVDSKWGYWYDSRLGRSMDLRERLELLLSANTLAPKGRHAGVRLFLMGKEVIPRFQGRGGKLLASGLETDPKTQIDIRAYSRSGTGHVYVRLDGLLQYAQTLYGQTPWDLTVDIATGLSPRDEGYPMTASRMQLSGETESRVDEITREISEDSLSATKDDSALVRMGAEDLDEAEVERRLRESKARVSALLADPAMISRMRLSEGGSTVLRELQERVEGLDYKIRVLRQAREEARRAPKATEQEPDDFWRRKAPEAPAANPRSKSGLSMRALRGMKTKEKKPRKIKPISNPFAGFAAVRVDRSQYPAKRLRPFFERPGPWIDLTLAWRIAIQLVLRELGENRDFDVGLVFDSKVRAEIETRSGHVPTLYINPEWFQTVLKAYRGRPLNVAAVLHSKVAHEVAHLTLGSGHSYHNERFVSERERIADETVGVLYPLAALVEGLLGVRGAPTPEARELELLQRSVDKLKKRLGTRGQGSKNEDGLVALRRRLVGEDEGDEGCGRCARAGVKRAW